MTLSRIIANDEYFLRKKENDVTDIYSSFFHFKSSRLDRPQKQIHSQFERMRDRRSCRAHFRSRATNFQPRIR